MELLAEVDLLVAFELETRTMIEDEDKVWLELQFGSGHLNFHMLELHNKQVQIWGRDLE